MSNEETKESLATKKAELEAQIQKEQQEQAEAFARAYQALCQDYGFQLVPQVILEAGQAPTVIMQARPLPKQT